nr:uncharacterized mitochondrial protein AtMg00810-like [Tanacetum cinerariifolium]
MIGSLMYLTTSRPDIMFAVCACARHQVTPKECHLHVVKRIFRYLKGHPKLGLWYPKESHFDLVAYSDSDYGGATQDRKSTTRGCQFLGRRASTTSIFILWWISLRHPLSAPHVTSLAEGSVPTVSEEVPSASLVFATATVVTPVTKRKGQEVTVESETLKKQKVQEQIDAQVARELEEKLEREDHRRAEQIAKDAEVARIHVEEELQSMIDGLDSNNETTAKYLQEYHQFSLELPIERRVELISDLVKY